MMENNMKQLMSKITLFFGILVASLCLVGCDKLVRDELDALQDQIDALTERVDQMNENVNSLSEIVGEIKNGGYVRTCTEIVSGGKIIGYRLTFSDGKEIVIYNGEDGQGGAAPIIGIRQDTDGEWYWTVDGEWLLNNGQKVKATGKDGVPGQPGVTPKLKIEDDYWYVSTDNGSTWTRLGKAKGDDGDAFFQNVDTSNPSYVLLVLSDGTEIKLNRYMAMSLNLSIPDEIDVSDGEVITITYTIEGTVSDQTVVTASSDGNYKVRVVKSSSTTGTIYVTCPYSIVDGYINVFLNDANGNSDIKVLNFFERKLTLSQGLVYNVSYSGGSVSIPVQYNFPYSLQCVGDAESWISVVQTKAAMQNGTIILNVAANQLLRARSGQVNIIPDNNPGFVQRTITINQASASFSIDNTNISVLPAGGSDVVNMMATRGVQVGNLPSWITTSLSDLGNYNYKLDLTFAPNPGTESRNAEIEILTTAGDLQGTINVIQLGSEYSSDKDLVFTVRPSMVTDFRVAIPLYGAVDCLVDWGDGQKDIVKRTITGTDYLTHQYDVNEPTDFDVMVSGRVYQLNSQDMPHKQTLIAIKQWGDVNLRSMAGAFKGTRIENIPADQLGGLADVTDFRDAFSGCTSLSVISPEAFSHCISALSFNGCFSGCSALTTLPENMFSGCTAVTDFEKCFYKCSALSTLPDNLFSGCSSATTFGSCFYECGALAALPGNMFSGCSAATTFDSCFYKCSTLTTLPASLFSDCTAAKSFSGCFMECGALSTLPGSLFSGCTAVTTFGSCFRKCSALTALPENLFSGCSAATSFVSCFRECGALSTLPGNVFSGCAAVTSFEVCFLECRSLAALPGDLFSDCKMVESFYECFQDCVALTTVPVQIFDNNRRVTNFSSCFLRCSRINGESPYTTINGEKVHLYQRDNYPDYFVKVTGYQYCFRGCSSLTDYASIPSQWKD